jgi:hypothetical protein
MILVAIAFAGQDPLPSHLGNPTAVEIAPGEGIVEAGAVLSVLNLGAHVDGVVGVTPRLALFADAYVAGGISIGLNGGAELGARYAVYQRRGFVVAPWVMAGTGGLRPGSGYVGNLVVEELFGIDGVNAPLLTSPTAMAGLAVEGGTERVRFDATVSVLTWEAEDGFADTLFWSLSRSEVGVSLRTSGVDADRHTFRLGLAGPLPNASWRFAPEDRLLTLEVLVGVPFVGLKVGHAF